MPVKVGLKVSSRVWLLGGRKGQGGRRYPCRCSSPDEHLQLRHQSLNHTDTSKHNHKIHCSEDALINHHGLAKSHWLSRCIHNKRHCWTRDNRASIASLQLACLFNTVSRRSTYNALTSLTLFISVR